jgi:hypothetical protein
MLKNVQIHFADRVPEPSLYQVIEKLALLKPHLLFVHDKDLLRYNTNRPIGSSHRESGDAEKSYASKFKVIDNGVLAGSLFIISDYSRRLNSKGWRIGVTSHLVHNERGDRDTKYTSDVAKALSNAKKYLHAKSMGRIVYEAYHEAYSEARDVVSRLTAPLARGNFLTGNADAQILLHAYLTDSVSTVADTDTAMRAKLLTPTFEKSLSEYYLAIFFADLVASNQTIFIHQVDGRYAFFTDGVPNDSDEAEKAAVTMMEFEQLPVATQEKLGVLQLMQNRELIKDMGMRANDDSFILM